jgi:hypothetical protein
MKMTRIIQLFYEFLYVKQHSHARQIAKNNYIFQYIIYSLNHLIMTRFFFVNARARGENQSRMRKGTIAGIACLLCCVMALPSCDKEDKGPKPKTEDQRWGYFEGMVAGQEYALKNAYPDKDVVTSSFWGVSGIAPDSSYYTCAKETAIELDKNTLLRVYLYNMVPGMRFLTLIDHSPEITESWIELIHFDRDSSGDIIMENGKQVLKARYVPGGKVNPFRMEVTDVVWANSWTAIIDVELDGTLYNVKNPQDSIVIKATYGAR